jgi:hypothetical protein
VSSFGGGGRIRRKKGRKIEQKYGKLEKINK